MEHLGVITATTTAKNNTNTAVPFTLAQGERILIQPDVACYVGFVATTTGAVTSGATGTGLQVEAGQTLELPVGNRLRYLSAVTAAGTVNLKVFRLYVNG